MKNWLPIILTVGLCAILSELGWSIEGSGIRSPVVSGTVPPSSISSGLIQSPNPIDTSGNLVITGNVTGGKHFRGLVPYGSVTSFRAPLGSSALDSFLRYSADLGDFGGPAEAYGPFYSPTGTVTTAMPGLPGVLTPATAKVRGRVGSLIRADSVEEIALPAGSGIQVLSGFEPPRQALGVRLPDFGAFQARPMSRTPQEMEEVISDELGGGLVQRGGLRGLRNLPPANVPSESLPLSETGLEQYQSQMEQSAFGGLKRIDDKAFELKQSLMADVTEPRDESLAGLHSDLRRMELVPGETGERFRPSIPLRPIEPSETVRRFETQLRQETSAGSVESQSGHLSTPSRRMPAFMEGPAGFQTRPSLQGQQATGVFPSDPAGLDKLVSAAEKKAKAAPMQTDKQLDIYDQIRQRLDDLIKPDTQYPSKDVLGKAKEVAGDTEGRVEQEYRTQDYQRKSKDHFQPVQMEISDGSRAAGSQQRVSVLDELSQIDVSARAKAILGGHNPDLYRDFSNDRYNWYIKAAQVYLKQGRYYRAADAYTLASIYKPDDPIACAGKSHALFAAGEFMSSALFLSRALELSPEYAPFKVDLVDIIGDRDKLESRIADSEDGLEISGAVELQFLLGYIYYQTGELSAAKKAIDAAYKKLPTSKAVIAVKKAIDSAVAGSQPTIK